MKILASEREEDGQSHIIDNGEQRVPDEVPKPLWIKLQNQQRQINQLQKKIDKIYDAVKPAGGVQPSTKGIKLLEEKGMKLTELGQDIYKEIRRQGYLDRRDIDEILSNHGQSKSKPTHIKYLRELPSKLNGYIRESTNQKLKFESGKQGGKGGGKISRVELVDC